MYAPEVIAERDASLVARYGDRLPGGRLVRRSHDECWAWRDQLADALDDDGQLTRPLTPAEDIFIGQERLLATIDFTYWAERWAIIAKEAQDAEPIFPLWASQDLFLRRLAALERDRWFGDHPDGLLINVLKARQLGLSTLAQILLAHRVTTTRTIRGMVAGDTPDQSSAMFSIAEQVIESLPWFLRPPSAPPTTKGTAVSFDTGASLRVLAGKSQRGGLQDRGKAKGNIGRGRTFGLVHLSELSTWERPEQIDDALLPGVPRRSRTLVIFESTAKGRYDWWHHQWLSTAKGNTRFTNIFIPWYIERDKYWLPAPIAWEPSDTTKAHAAMVEATSPQYLLGETYRLSREQLVWYEQTRTHWAEQDRLYKFLEEYPATAEEAFQHAGRSIFGAGTIERLTLQAHKPEVILLIEPAKDIAQLQEWERAQPPAAQP
jgi:hypothetical protein